MKNVLITGGAGFIGSNMVKFLHEKEKSWNLIVYDKLTYSGNLENLKSLEKSDRFIFIKGDVCDGKKFSEVLEEYRPEIIFHFAAESHVDRSILDPSPFIKTNVEGTQVILHCILQSRNPPLLVHISTDEVYGPAESGKFFDEKSPLNPSSPYSSSKASADLIVMSYMKTYGLEAIIVRPSNNYGPYQFPEKLIPLTITNALEEKEIPIYGDGLQERDWIYVEDACTGIYLVTLKGKPGEIYNLPGEEIIKNIDVVKTILKILKKDPSLIKHVKDRPAHDRRYAMSGEKIKAETGWRPSVRFGEGIKKTVNWYLENRKWWEKIKSGKYLEYYERQYMRR